MAKFLTTSGTSYHIEQIIIGAKKNIILLSPYLFLSKTLLERLQDADRNGISVYIVYSQNKLRAVEIEVLSTFKNLHILYSQNLHAKCYFNQEEMIITSMNMYEFSEKNNREMGILINRHEDKEIYRDAYKEAKSIFDAAQPCDLAGKVIEENKKVVRVQKKSVEEQKKIIQSPEKILNLNSTKILDNKAFCIRCRGDVSHNSRRPLCAKCYVPWSKFKNRTYQEKYCHQCGLESMTSVSQPICENCVTPKSK